MSCILVIRHLSYRKKHLSPKLKKLRPKKIFYKKPLFWVILSLIAICWIIYFVLFSKTVQITSIEVNGNEKIAGEDIKSFAWRNAEIKILDWKIVRLATSSIFLSKIKNIRQGILLEFPLIEDAEITKKLFQRSLFITIKERKPFAVFCPQVPLSAERCFIIDESGIVFEETESAEQNFLVVKSPAETNELSLGKKVIEKNIIDAISAVQKNLMANFQIIVKEALISDYLVFKTSEGWEVYFNRNGDIQFQITKLNALLEKEISPSERKKIQYIYLQYKDRAYYK